MREIKFRGLRTDCKGWAYGNLHKGENIRGEIYYEIGYGHNYYKVLPETVGQFTGLKDKNRVDIYECDVLKDPNQRERRPRDKGHGYYIVQYSNGGYVTETYNGNFLVKPSLSNKNSILEVIGNIYENQELLK